MQAKSDKEIHGSPNSPDILPTLHRQQKRQQRFEKVLRQDFPSTLNPRRPIPTLDSSLVEV
jgi:hypothetical protein